MAPPPTETTRQKRLKRQLPPRHFDDAKPQVFNTPTRRNPPPRLLKTPGDAPRPDPGPNPVLKRVKTGEYDGYPYPPGPKKQHKQRGKSREYDKRRYHRKRQQQKQRANLWYKRMKNMPAVERDRKRRRENPERFERLPGGGSADPADRAKKWRDKKRDGGSFFIIERGSPETDERPRRQIPSESPDVPWHQEIEEQPDYKETGPWRATPPRETIRAAEGTALQAAAWGSAEVLRHRSQGLLVVRASVAQKWTEFRVLGSSGIARRVRLAGAGPGRWVRASCSCPFWVFGGPEYHARQGGYLLGDPRGPATPPNVRDPQGQNLLCKHVLAALQWGQRAPGRRGRTNLPTYQMRCQGCGARGDVRLAASAKPVAACQQCQGSMEAVLPDRLALVQRGDDWVGRAQKLRGQMAARSARVGRAQEEQRRELPRLQPNVGGMRTDTWAEAARLARSQGLDASPYEERSRQEDRR